MINVLDTEKRILAENVLYGSPNLRDQNYASCMKINIILIIVKRVKVIYVIHA